MNIYIIIFASFFVLDLVAMDQNNHFQKIKYHKRQITDKIGTTAQENVEQIILIPKLPPKMPPQIITEPNMAALVVKYQQEDQKMFKDNK